jgi:hypothetical protein
MIIRLAKTVTGIKQHTKPKQVKQISQQYEIIFEEELCQILLHA